MEIKICEIIKDLRKEKELGQEALADAMGVSVQAVSKWETGNSLPDVALLPRIASFFGVTVDYLFFGPRETGSPEAAVPEINVPFSNDGVLRVVQFVGTTLITKHMFERNQDMHNTFIPLAIDKVFKDKPISIEIWGSAKIEGDVGGYVQAGDSVNCGNVGAHVEAGDGVNCGNVGAHINAGDGVNCGNVGAHVEAGDGVNCGSVSGNVNAGDSVKCGNVGGNVEAGDGVSCGSVGGDVNAGDEVKCGDINGSVECEGDLYCKEIKGDVHCEGDIHIEKKD